MDTRTVGHIFINRSRKGVRFPRHPTKATGGDPGSLNILTMQPDLPFDAHAPDGIMHPVEARQRRGFTTARRPDKGQDLAPMNIETHIPQRQFIAVKQREVAHGHHQRGGFAGGAGAGRVATWVSSNITRSPSSMTYGKSNPRLQRQQMADFDLTPSSENITETSQNDAKRKNPATRGRVCSN